MTGRFYVVATPIGHLGDLPPRAAEVLAQADLIVAEDTRRSGRLLKHLGIGTPMISCHEHNEDRRLVQVLDALQAGGDVALISDAGTPAISDPGFLVVRHVAAAELEIVVVPGPCAAVAALVGSGLPTDRFLFAGFPPKKAGKRRRWMEELKSERGTLIVYESPFRIARTCAELADVLGNRQACVGRELTKMHEEFLRDTLIGLADRFEGRTPKGELVLVVAGTGRDGRGSD